MSNESAQKNSDRNSMKTLGKVRVKKNADDHD